MKCAIAMVIALCLTAQDPRFDAQSRLVLVPVTVTDKKGKAVDGLEPADFILLDNGQPQRAVVDTFATGVAPIALVVAVQASGISAPVLDKVRKVGAMIQPLITGERGCAALVAFDERVQWLQECTSDVNLLEGAFRKLSPGEPRKARMLDAVHAAVERLQRRANVRRVLLLVSESRDRGSESELDAVVMAAEAAGVAVYAATYSATTTAFTRRPTETPDPLPRGPSLPTREPESPPGRERVPIPPPEQRVDILAGIGELARLGKTNTAQVLTKRTGGRTFSFARQKGLEDAVEGLGSELHTQYLLSFTPEEASPGYHALEVRLTRRGDYRIRWRPTYWSRADAPTVRSQ